MAGLWMKQKEDRMKKRVKKKSWRKKLEQTERGGQERSDNLLYKRSLKNIAHTLLMKDFHLVCRRSTTIPSIKSRCSVRC